jgi:ferredoxin
MIKVDEELCDHCGTCVAVCPMDCMLLSVNTLHIVADLCNGCGACVRVCPLGALKKVAKQGELQQ